jgi:enoyl-CoA hydratase
MDIPLKTEDDAVDFSVDQHPTGAVFRLNRPQKLNSLTTAIWSGLVECVDALEARRARFLIITAEGDRAFCAGTDLNESKLRTAEQRDEKNDSVRAFLLRLSRSELISIAALNGLAYGGGLELAMACTFRIASPDVKMAMPEIKLGVLPTYGGTQFLVALIGAARAADLMLTGRAITAAEALTFGLINKIASPGVPLVAQALEYSEVISNFSPVATAAIRRCIAGAGPFVTTEGLALEGREARIVLNSDDAREGVAAFLEKRPPRFTGQ